MQFIVTLKPTALLILPDAGRSKVASPSLLPALWCVFVWFCFGFFGLRRRIRALTCFIWAGTCDYFCSFCFQSAENGGWKLESKASSLTRMVLWCSWEAACQTRAHTHTHRRGNNVQQRGFCRRQHSLVSLAVLSTPQPRRPIKHLTESSASIMSLQAAAICASVHSSSEVSESRQMHPERFYMAVKRHQLWSLH